MARGFYWRLRRQPVAAAVTASFGAAEYSDGATDAVTLMRIADEGLYEAKARGRNQIVLKSGNGTEERT